MCRKLRELFSPASSRFQHMEELISCCCYLLLLALPLLSLFILLKKSSSRKSPNPPPSPRALPIIGHLHLIKDPLHLSLASLSSRHGPIFSLRLGCRSFVVVSSPSAVEECFTKNDVVLSNRPRTMAGDRVTYNYTAYVWAPYGHYWRTIRKVSVIELFSTRSLQNSAQIRQEEACKILRVLSSAGDSRNKVDLNYLALIYSFNHVARAVAGKSLVEEGEIGSESGKEKVKRIRGTFSPSLSEGICDYFPILRRVGYKGLERDLISLQGKREEFLQGLIGEVKGKIDGGGRQKSCLIDTLLRLQASEPEFYTEDVVKSTVQMMFVAGTETSAMTIQWAMSLLLTNSGPLLKLRQEIDDKIGHDHLLNESDLSKLPYLRSVVNETLRLYPPAPLLLPHHSSEDFIVGGYNLTKGTTLLVNVWAMQRDPKLWDHPDEFNPDRFMDGEIEQELCCQFVPFGMGRRSCPGSVMGMRMIMLVLGLFVQCFEWEKEVGREEMEGKYRQVVLQKVKPLEVVCIVRHEAARLLAQL